VFGDRAPLDALRGLEVQLAVRHDDQEQDFPTLLHTVSPILRRNFTGTAYTAGAKVAPTRWLTLRGSYSTGEVPPRISALAEGSFADQISGAPVPDPKRPGDTIDLFSIDTRSGANPDLKTLRANTSFLGFILTPAGVDGPRLALHYSPIHRSRDAFAFGFEEVLAHEDDLPGAIGRAPLTDADRAAGFSVGRVTSIDARIRNDASTSFEAVDAHAEWPLSAFGGRLHLY